MSITNRFTLALKQKMYITKVHNARRLLYKTGKTILNKKSIIKVKEAILRKQRNFALSDSYLTKKFIKKLPS